MTHNAPESQPLLLSLYISPMLTVTIILTSILTFTLILIITQTHTHTHTHNTHTHTHNTHTHTQTHTGRLDILVVRLTPTNAEIIKDLFDHKSIKMAVVGAKDEISRLLHIWSLEEQDGACGLMKQRFVDVQEMAMKDWKLSSGIKLEAMCQRILGSTKIVKWAMYDGGSKATNNDRYKVLSLSLSLCLSLYIHIHTYTYTYTYTYTHTHIHTYIYILTASCMNRATGLCLRN